MIINSCDFEVQWTIFILIFIIIMWNIFRLSIQDIDSSRIAMQNGIWYLNTYEMKMYD